MPCNELQDKVLTEHTAFTGQHAPHSLHMTATWLHFQVAEKARQRHQEAAAASKHALKSSLYWKGAIGRAHSNLRRSALQQVHQANRDAKHGLVEMGHGRQAKGKQQHHDRQLMSNFHGQLNMLKAYTLRTDMQHRYGLLVCAVFDHQQSITKFAANHVWPCILVLTGPYHYACADVIVVSHTVEHMHMVACHDAVGKHAIAVTLNQRFFINCPVTSFSFETSRFCCYCYKSRVLRLLTYFREKLETEAAWAAVLEERVAEAERQAHILSQQQAAQRAKQVAGEVVRAIPVLAGKRRLHILQELQDLVDTRCVTLLLNTVSLGKRIQ